MPDWAPTDLRWMATDKVPPMGLVNLPRDGASYRCGFFVDSHGVVCGGSSTQGVSEEFWKKTDYLSFRAICPVHIAVLDAARLKK